MNPVEYAGREKRITFQLYNYWFGLADDYGIPPLTSLCPEDIAPYKSNMVLIDLREPDNEPTLQVVGQLLKQDLGPEVDIHGVSEIPRGSLLSRITDHYMEVLATKSPISFDAEFNNKARDKILYRGILLPFSDDGETINFILGAIRWIKEDEKAAAEENMAEPEHTVSGEAPLAQENGDAGPLVLERLEHCRRLVQGQSPADLRSRKSLYETLGAILDFHELCSANPACYEDLLQAEGLKAQKRAPFTPTLKLCFGRDYDKTRLTEYAAALSFARKNNQDGASLPSFLDQFPGGIKGCVRAEREGRSLNSDKPVREPLKSPREIINGLPSLTSFDISENTEDIDEGCLLLARRNGSRMEIIKILNENEDVLAPILKRLAGDP